MLSSKETYSAFRLYIIFFGQYACSLRIEPTTFCAANAMLYQSQRNGIYAMYLGPWPLSDL